VNTFLSHLAAPRRAAVAVVNIGHGLQSPCQARRLSLQFLDNIVSSGIERWVPLFHAFLSMPMARDLKRFSSWPSLDEEIRHYSRLCAPNVHHPQREDVILRHRLGQKKLSGAGNYDSSLYVFLLMSSLPAVIWTPVLTAKVPPHATSCAGMEQKSLWRHINSSKEDTLGNIWRERRRPLRTVTESRELPYNQ
jgi:hypothetical protein